MQAFPPRQHLASRRCQNGRVQKRKRDLEIEHLRALSTEFRINGSLLENVETFRYTAEDWPCVSHKIQQARRCWGHFSVLLRHKGANPRVCGLLYKAVVMSTLLYASKTWMITKPLLRALEGFHNRITRCIAKLQPRYHQVSDSWEYPDIELAQQRAGIYWVQHYLERRRCYLVRHARDLPLLLDCVAADIGGATLSWAMGPLKHLATALTPLRWVVYNSSNLSRERGREVRAMGRPLVH